MTRQVDEVSTFAGGNPKDWFQAPLPERACPARSSDEISSDQAGTGALGRLVRVLRWAKLRHSVIRSVDDLPDELRAQLCLEPGTRLRQTRGEKE